MAADYYEVLGIRPTATNAEIELAFKGRRSQYHPDRYTSMDAETIAWATARMQEVNEAYRVLSDPDSRKAFDARRPSAQHGTARPSSSDGARNQARHPPSPPPASDLPDEPLILDYLTDIGLDGEDADRFHLAPNIPSRKLATALRSRNFAQTAPPRAVYLLVDDTVFRGGADGLLITDQFLSFKAAFMNPCDLLYAPGGWRGGLQASKGKILRMGTECLSFSLFTASGVQKLVWAINSYFADRLRWHQEMAEHGNVESQFFMSGSLEDEEIALHWLVHAAKGGHVVAQHNLGVGLMSVDLEQAYAWLLKAAQQGSVRAREQLRSNRFAQFQSM